MRVSCSAPTRLEEGAILSNSAALGGGAFKSFLQRITYTKISATYLVGCGSRSELVVHMKLIVYIFVTVNIGKPNRTKINFTK